MYGNQGLPGYHRVGLDLGEDLVHTSEDPVPYPIGDGERPVL